MYFEELYKKDIKTCDLISVSDAFLCYLWPVLVLRPSVFGCIDDMQISNFMLEEVWEMLLQSRKTAQLGRGGVVSYAFTENKIVLIDF